MTRRLVKRSVWLAAALASVGLLIGLNAYEPGPAAAPMQAAMPVLIRNAPAADRIQIVHQGAILDLERRGQTWCLAQNGGYPVNPATASRLLDQLLALRLAPSDTASRAAFADADTTIVRVLAATGASLGALVVAAHEPGASHFLARQIGDTRVWAASGPLDAPADKRAWIDRDILPVAPDRLTGATISTGHEAFTVDAADAAARLAHLQGLPFSDIRPAAQMLAPETGRLVFTLAGGGTLAIAVRAEPDAVWLGLAATAPGIVAIPPGQWVFRYPAAAATLLQPPQ